MGACKYAIKSGARLKNDPQLIGETLRDIEREKGLTPETLLEESRPENAPLHNEFEWDDSKAAEEYRKTQARYIIRAVVEIIDEPESGPVTIRAFQSVNDDGRKYVNTRLAIATQSYYEQLLENARRDAESFASKYKQLTEVKDIISAITRFLPTKVL